MTAALPPDASLWDWISSPGVTNIATAAGVLAALGIAGKAVRDRRKEQHAEAEGEARLFRIEQFNLQQYPAQPGRNVGAVNRITFVGSFHGPTAIFDVRYEVWTTDRQLSDEPVTERRDVIAPEDNNATTFNLPAGTTPYAWQVVWRDRHGSQWVIDQVQQVTPERFKPGRTPRRTPIT